jgi:hypothetical protein
MEDHQTAPRQLLTALAHTAAVLFALLAVHLIIRRLSGALVQPLGGPAIIGVAIALAASAAALRVWLTSEQFVLSTQYSVLRTRQARGSPSQSGFVFPSLWIAPGIAMLLVLATLTIPGTPHWGTAVAWIALLGSEAASWLAFLNPSIVRTRNSTVVRATDTTQQDADEPELPAGLVQQMTRVRQDEGESIQALVHCQFATGDRFSVAHLAFCPPLATPPKLTAHALDHSTAEVRITHSETFGARIEVRVPRGEDAAQGVVVEVLGSATATGPRCD